MVVVVCENNKKPYVKEIENSELYFESVIEGYIRTIGSQLRNVLIVCDEEGFKKGLKPNRFDILGTFFFIGVETENFEYRSLTVEEIEQIKKLVEKYDLQTK